MTRVVTDTKTKPLVAWYPVTMFLAIFVNLLSVKSHNLLLFEVKEVKTQGSSVYGFRTPSRKSENFKLYRNVNECINIITLHFNPLRCTSQARRLSFIERTAEYFLRLFCVLLVLSQNEEALNSVFGRLMPLEAKLNRCKLNSQLALCYRSRPRLTHLRKVYTCSVYVFTNVYLRPFLKYLRLFFILGTI